MADQSALTPLPTPKCCFFPVDTLCLIFAICSAVKWGFCMVICSLIFVAEPSLFTFILFVVFFVVFMFAVLLCYGTNKRRSDLLKIYLIYAVAMKVLLCVAVILYCLFTLQIAGGMITLVVSFVGFYTGVVMLVKRTHDYFVAEESRISSLLLGPKCSTKAYNSVESSAPAEP